MSITRIPPSGIDTQALSAVLGRGTVAYSTIQQLPLTNNSTGSTAFVSATNRLYIWNGTGWFNIALINTSPTITTGPNATYAFATNGTPVVITLVAQDPEGIPITWSHQVTSGTLGSTATISQVNNVFTITPSTNTAHAGSFGVTFTASDGVNVATATSSFTLAFGPTIGGAYGGGFYAGQISTTGNGVATHNLIVGPASTAQNVSIQWKTTNTTTAGTSSAIDGPTNSANMNNASHPAAQFCEGLTIGGFSDWYMPARNELEVCYFNLKPTTATNSTGSGINPNAVPARSSTYTSGTPAQTSAAAFQTGGAQAFSLGSFWSSTESSAALAWGQATSSGYQGTYGKMNIDRVRAIRRVPV